MSGEVEVKVDPQDGALLQFIVIEAPSSAAMRGGQFIEEAVSGVPIVDCSPWGRQDNPDYSMPRDSVVSVVAELFCHADSGVYRIEFGTSASRCSVRCGDISVEYAGDGDITAVEALIGL
ncbi:hypothetical protein [Streptomyces sp. HNM0574]|uniref:hypothetical protein n=1 Tax=Streptomyces sp. HNM0574 TaxID=2714954 RepID=UPI00146C9830|nr:hypothetical protein [Streptomyces sp. HNM0574]NLU66683.1 hypothetical protein [Streptomyces sp. HNM0574]